MNQGGLDLRVRPVVFRGTFEWRFTGCLSDAQYITAGMGVRGASRHRVATVAALVQIHYLTAVRKYIAYLLRLQE